jgi:hypothetical protein
MATFAKFVGPALAGMVTTLLAPNVIAAGPNGGIDVTVVNIPMVRSADNPALQPVNFGAGLGRSPAAAAGTFKLDGPSYTVPAGKRLVVEFVSIEFGTDSAALVSSYATVRSTPGGSVALGGSTDAITCTEAGSFSCITISKPVKLYADPGAQVSVHGVITVRSATIAPLFMNHGFNGYLVDLE